MAENADPNLDPAAAAAGSGPAQPPGLPEDAALAGAADLVGGAARTAQAAAPVPRSAGEPATSTDPALGSAGGKAAVSERRGWVVTR